MRKDEKGEKEGQWANLKAKIGSGCEERGLPGLVGGMAARFFLAALLKLLAPDDAGPFATVGVKQFLLGHYAQWASLELEDAHALEPVDQILATGRHPYLLAVDDKHSPSYR
jgi:hypothetical protein